MDTATINRMIMVIKFSVKESFAGSNPARKSPSRLYTILFYTNAILTAIITNGRKRVSNYLSIAFMLD